MVACTGGMTSRRRETIAMAASRNRRHRHGRYRTGLRETANLTMVAAAGGVESNKGVSEGLSALGGKSTRVRRENAF